MTYTISAAKEEFSTTFQDVINDALELARQGEAVSITRPEWGGAYVGTYLCPGVDGVHATPKYFPRCGDWGFGGDIPADALAIARGFTEAAKGLFTEVAA